MTSQKSAPTVLSVTVDAHGAGQRTDRYLSEQAGIASRSQLRQRLTTLRVNGRTAKPSTRLGTGDLIEAVLAPLPPLAMLPEPIPLEVLFENDDVVVVNKASGMVVHPGSGNRTGTLVNALLSRYRDLADRFPDSARPGIVHRLDKDTSGVLIVAKHAAARARLAAQFSARQVNKIYHAWVAGHPLPASGRIATRLRRDPRDPLRFRVSAEQGKWAVTRYRVLTTQPGAAFVALRPITGRTHQLRVHLRWLGHPVLGDPLYAGRARGTARRLLLHARRLTIVLPGTDIPHTFEAPLPPDFTPPPGG